MFGQKFAPSPLPASFLAISLLFFCSNVFASANSDSLAGSILTKIQTLRLSGEYGQALQLLNDPSLQAAVKGDQTSEPRMLKEYILNYWNSGQIKDSENAARKALAVRGLREEEKSVFEEILRIHQLYNAAKDLRLKADYDGSIKSFEEAIGISKKISISDFELKCLRQMSICYWDQNDFDRFGSINQIALIISKKIKNKKDEGICLNNIGLYNWKISNYAKALESYEKALALARAVENIQSENECLNNLGIIYQELGEYDRALEYYFKALALDKKVSEKSYLAIDLNNIGTTYRKKGLASGNKSDFQTALSYFENCLALAEKENDGKTALQIRNNIGTIYADLEEYSNAIIQYKKGLEISEKIGDKESASAILNNLGIVYYNLGDFEESTRYCQGSIDLAQQIKSGTVLWEAFLDVGNAYKKRSRMYEAKKSYQESIAVIENIRSNIEIEELKASYFGSHKRLESYYNLIDLLAQEYIQNRDRRAGAQAFEYLEKAKARAFLDSLEVAQVNISQGVNIRLANREKQIDRALTILYKKALASDLPAEQREKIEADIKAAEDELEKLKREIRSTSPAYANLKYPKVMTLEEARKYLIDGQTAVLAFAVGKDVSYGFAMTKNGLSIYPLASRKLLREKIADHLKIISDKDSRDFTAATNLCAALVEPALGPGIKRLIIVPDDALHYLPFETLRSKIDGRWLIEKYAIAYAPSLSSLWEIVKRAGQQKEARTKDLMAFGDPDYGRTDASAPSAASLQDRFSPAGFPRLAYSGSEVRKISAFFKEGKKDIRVRELASEQELKKLPLQKYKIIHFAAHGVIDDQNPARSAIVLSIAGDDREDGFVQMREIYNLRLNADLVSLSACQTGRGLYVQGEGIEGLNRAFFYAGASAVMTSLWSINDQASAQLMERFYSHLRNHLTLMDALRAAKIEMIRSGVLSHPYYWGAFILTGNAERKPFSRSVFNALGLALALSAVMGASIIWKTRSHGKRKSRPRAK